MGTRANLCLIFVTCLLHIYVFTVTRGAQLRRLHRPAETVVDDNHSLSMKIFFAGVILVSLHGYGALTRQTWGIARFLPLASGLVLRSSLEARRTTLWWAGLCGASLLNVALWLVATRVELPDATTG